MNSDQRPFPASRRHAMPIACWLALLIASFALDAMGEEGIERPSLAQSTSQQVNRAHKADRRMPAAKLPAARKPPAEPTSPHSPERAPGLHRFYDALAQLESGTRRKPVTVLHLGDSHIASDRLTADLRRRLQERFGGAGRGMLMPGFPFPYYEAQGVRFEKGGTWTAFNSLNGDVGPFGITGVRLATSEPEAWLRLKSETGPFEWAEVTFVSEPTYGTAVLIVNEAEMTVDTSGDAMATKTVRVDYKGRFLTIRAKGDGAVGILSWAVGADRPGVRYVNLGIPGATADITARWDKAIVAADIERLDPDLIVLGYGTNEGFDDNLDPTAYEERVVALLGMLAGMAPGAALAVIGPPDGARLPRVLRDAMAPEAVQAADCRSLDSGETRDYGSLVSTGDARLARWHPPPKLVSVRSALARAAQRSGAWFWDWSQLMGGACGIHAWAKAEPALAAADHVHITIEGSRRSAAALFKDMMSGYAAHRATASR